jgi:hypothetical protein
VGAGRGRGAPSGSAGPAARRGRRAARCRRESGASPPKACNDDATDALAVTQIVPRWRLPASVGNLAIDLFHERAQALGSLSASGLLVVGDPDGVADHTRELDALLLQVSRHARIVVSKAYIEELHAGSVKTELSLCQTDSGAAIRRLGRGHVGDPPTDSLLALRQ